MSKFTSRCARPSNPLRFRQIARRSRPVAALVEVGDLDAIDRRDSVVKRADPVWDPPLTEIDPEDYEDYLIVKCGDLGYVKVGDKISGGGSANVYKAITQDKKYIAFKAVDNLAARDKEWDLVQEVRNNLNIVKFLAKCKKFGTEYPLAMELVEGGTLQTRIDSKVYSKLRTESAVKGVMEQVFSAIEQAHKKGVAHCDIKGDNIIMHQNKAGPAETLILIDFGDGTTENTVEEIDVAGGIRSPEAETQTTTQIDPKSNDIWELGTLLVSLLIGKKPWPSSVYPNAESVWYKRDPLQRSKACKKEWPQFTTHFCDILVEIFTEQDTRKPLETLSKRIINPNLKVFEDDEMNKDA